MESDGECSESNSCFATCCLGFISYGGEKSSDKCELQQLHERLHQSVAVAKGFATDEALLHGIRGVATTWGREASCGITSSQSNSCWHQRKKL